MNQRIYEAKTHQVEPVAGHVQQGLRVELQLAQEVCRHTPILVPDLNRQPRRLVFLVPPPPSSATAAPATPPAAATAASQSAKIPVYGRCCWRCWCRGFKGQLEKAPLPHWMDRVVDGGSPAQFLVAPRPLDGAERV